MRILQVVQKLQRRGPEILSRRLDEAFRRAGHVSSTVFLYSYRGESPLEMGSDDTCLEGREGHPFETTLGFHPALLTRLVRKIRSYRPDIVQVNGSRSVKYGALAALLAPRRKWALVYRNIDNPDYWVRDALRQAYYRFLIMPRMDGVISVSRGMMEVLRRRYGFRVPVVWIPYVVDPERLEPILDRQRARLEIGVDAAAQVALFVGNLSEQKRPDRFVRVVDRVRGSVVEAEGWILGDGALAPDVRRQVVDLGLVDAIRMWGYRRDVGAIMAAADVLVVTSDSDGIPTVVQEAGYLQTPVVATRVGGMAECVQEGVTGFLVDPDDEEGLAERVGRILEDAELRDRLGQASRRQVEKVFTITSATASHLDFFSRLLFGQDEGSRGR